MVETPFQSLPAQKRTHAARNSIQEHQAPLLAKLAACRSNPLRVQSRGRQILGNAVACKKQPFETPPKRICPDGKNKGQLFAPLPGALAHRFPLMARDNFYLNWLAAMGK
jgi:hypothetical protein